MPPKGRSAKAKAKAKVEQLKHTRRQARRHACVSLNALANELHVAATAPLDTQSPLPADVEALAKLVEKRAQTEEHRYGDWSTLLY